MNTDFLSAHYVKALYAKYEEELSCETLSAMKQSAEGEHDGALSRVDAELVYMLVRELGARKAIEFSPNYGYSTAFVAAALKQNQPEYTFATFDLELYRSFLERMQRFNLQALFTQGDALTNVPLYLVENDLVGKIDFCFIDSDHSYDFARRYCVEILPLLGERCVYFIHDMCYRPQDFQSFSHYGPISPYEIGGTYSSLGEAAYLSEYFRSVEDRYAIFSTHRLFGDSHEFSSILPRNKPLINELSASIRDFSLPLSAGQEGGIPRCPMGLIVVPKVMLYTLNKT